MKLSNVLDKKYSHTNTRITPPCEIVATEIILHDLTKEETELIHQFLTKAMQGKYDKDFNRSSN